MMDSPALRQLSRAQIQGIARREKIKANGRSEDIIRLLVQKYPGGVPRTPSPRSPLAGRERAPIRYKRLTSENTKPTEIDKNTMQMTEPSAKDMRRVMRDLAKMVDAGPEIQSEIEETQILLKKARSIIKEVEKDLKEVVWTRICLEEDFMTQLKEEQSLWDGTKLMKGEPRRLWECFLRKEKRKQEEELERKLPAAAADDDASKDSASSALSSVSSRSRSREVDGLDKPRKRLQER